TVMLSTFAPLSVNSAKHLAAQRDRPFAALRACPERSEWGDSGGADLSSMSSRFIEDPPQVEGCKEVPDVSPHLGMSDITLLSFRVAPAVCVVDAAAFQPSPPAL